MPRDTSDDRDTVNTALQNLEQIQQGEDPRSQEPETTDSVTVSQEQEQTLDELDTDDYDDRLRLAEAEVGRLYAKHDLNEHLSIEKLHVCVAEWKSRHGVCKYNKRLGGDKRFGRRMTSLPRKSGHHVIGINATIEDDDDFVDTVRHELAHAIVYAKYGSSQKHNHNWKAMARRLGADDSARHNRAHSDDDEKYDYYVFCVDCGAENGRTRRSKTVKQPFNYNCGSCGGDLSSYDSGSGKPDQGNVVAVESLDYDDRDGWIREGCP